MRGREGDWAWGSKSKGKKEADNVSEKESGGKGLEERESRSEKHAENSESDRQTETERGTRGWGKG